MRKELSRWLIILLTCWVAAAIVSSCATSTKPRKMRDEDVLRGRVQEYWSYRIKGQWDKCYQYELPGYKEKISMVAYINQNSRFLLRWEGYDILELWTSGEEGYVKLNTKYRYIIPQTNKAAFETVAEEKWEKMNDQWYRVSPLV
jgi:hypothetical protein